RLQSPSRPARDAPHRRSCRPVAAGRRRAMAGCAPAPMTHAPASAPSAVRSKLVHFGYGSTVVAFDRILDVVALADFVGLGNTMQVWVLAGDRRATGHASQRSGVVPRETHSVLVEPAAAGPCSSTQEWSAFAAQ